MSEQVSGEVAKGSGESGLLYGAGLARALASPPIVVLLVLGAIYHTAVIISTLPGREKAFDFSVFYCAGIALQHHIDPYTADLSPIAHRLGIDLHRQIHTADTPPALLLFQPFSLLPPAPAYWGWFALNTSAFVIAIYLLLFAHNCDREEYCMDAGRGPAPSSCICGSTGAGSKTNSDIAIAGVDDALAGAGA
jgi:hypothetical protein